MEAQPVNITLTSFHMQGVSSSGSQDGSGGGSNVGTLAQNAFEQAIHDSGLSVAKYRQASGNDGTASDKADDIMQTAQQQGSATDLGQLQRQVAQLRQLLRQAIKKANDEKDSSGQSKKAATGGGQSGETGSANGSGQSGGSVGDIFDALAKLGKLIQKIADEITSDAQKMTGAVNSTKGTTGTARQDGNNEIMNLATQIGALGQKLKVISQGTQSAQSSSGTAGTTVART